MRERYRIATRTSTPSRQELSDWLAKDGQLLMPLVELLEKGERAIDEVIDVMGRATVEAVLRMSAEQVAGPAGLPVGPASSSPGREVACGWSRADCRCLALVACGLQVLGSRGRSSPMLVRCALMALLILIGVWVLAAQVPDSSNDRAALVALYHATGGPNWRNNANWLSSKPLDSWYGVDTRDGRVIFLSLYGNGLTGRIPRSLRRLDRLQSLRLGDNRLTGPLPPWLGDLGPRMWELHLQNNQLTGRIPSAWLNLTSLQHLWLDVNRLTGPIPSWLGDMRRLQSLSLSNNQFTGPIPPELGKARNLTDLDLAHNLLSGRMPPRLRGLTKLLGLDVSDNRLTGPVPSWLGNLTGLLGLDVSNNRLTGPVPSWLGNLTRLRGLALGGNELTGRVPTTLRNLTNLEGLHLGPNRLSGRIPAWLGDLQRLRRLTLGPNEWAAGPLPAWLQTKRYFLLDLKLNDSQLTGRIPAWMGQFPYLRTLDLSGNRLTGRIPASVDDLTRLNHLDLSSNRLTGRIPSLSDLTVLWSPGPELESAHRSRPACAGLGRVLRASGSQRQSVDRAYSGLAGRANEPLPPGPQLQPAVRAGPRPAWGIWRDSAICICTTTGWPDRFCRA